MTTVFVADVSRDLRKSLDHRDPFPILSLNTSLDKGIELLCLDSSLDKGIEVLRDWHKFQIFQSLLPKPSHAPNWFVEPPMSLPESAKKLSDNENKILLTGW